MIKTMEWLQAKVPGFKRLSKDEQNAIADFSLLWGLFESRILDTQGNARNICAKISAWHEAGTLDVDAFDADLAYFRERYYAQGAFTDHYNDLHFRRPDREDQVSAVIAGGENDPCSRMAAILIIVFRYRNNLFHGVKWEYWLEGQFENFTTANAILMKILEQHGALAEI